MVSHAVGAPSAGLREYVEHYVGLRAYDLAPGSHSALPSRYAMLAISLGPPIGVVSPQNSQSYSYAFSGLLDAPATVVHGSHRDAVYVSIKPTGIRALLGVTAPEAAGRTIDLRDLWGRATDSLAQQMKEAPDWQACFAVLDQHLLARVTRRPNAPLVWAWDTMQRESGSITVDQLAHELGWSRRHFSERFREEIGLAPKVAARILRFEHACRMIKHERPPLSHVAAACGFYDQAHMTLEWNQLAGCTPHAWIAKELPFFQDYDAWTGDNGRHEHRAIGHLLLQRQLRSRV